VKGTIGRNYVVIPVAPIEHVPVWKQCSYLVEALDLVEYRHRLWVKNQVALVVPEVSSQQRLVILHYLEVAHEGGAANAHGRKYEGAVQDLSGWHLFLSFHLHESI
jgi:hypothetical protein